MPVVSPPAITALPTPPDPNDRTTFNARAYPWSVAQQTFGTQVGAVAANVFANATDAATSATSSAASAAAATTNGANQVALATTQANAAAASAVLATTNGAAQVALAAAQAGIAAASANYKGVWATLTGALNMPASVSHNNVFWALNSNLVDVTTATPGVSAAWTQIAGNVIKRVVRSSNTALASTDVSKIISMTGTYTQTFSAAAALGDGWFCYLRNDGAGDITLDPSGTELIDGLSSYIMYPGEVRLVQCDGTAFTSIVLQTFLKIGTTSAAWVKPPGYQYIDGMAWGGGGSGALVAGAATGGGGGACHPFRFLASTLPASLTYIVGSGGAAITSTGNQGNGGGNSSFSTAVAYGGGGGSNVATSGGGGGGGIMSAGANGSGGLPGFTYHASNATIDNAGFGGGGIFNNGTNTFGGNSVYGGGSSGTSQVGKSIYGGGAGGSYYVVTAGTSIYGGAGGAGAAAGVGTAGVAPAGGGGSGMLTTSGAGARGEIRIWGVI